MAVTAGTRLGHYNVTALIGEGDEILNIRTMRPVFCLQREPFLMAAK
jgi:hypothetical protein